MAVERIAEQIGPNRLLPSRRSLLRVLTGGALAAVAADLTSQPGFLRTATRILIPRTSEAAENKMTQYICEFYLKKPNQGEVKVLESTPQTVESLMAPTIYPDNAPRWNNACLIAHPVSRPDINLREDGVQIDYVSVGFNNRLSYIQASQADKDLDTKIAALFTSAGNTTRELTGIPLKSFSKIPVDNGLIILGNSKDYTNTSILVGTVMDQLSKKGYQPRIYVKGQPFVLVRIFLVIESSEDSHLGPSGGLKNGFGTAITPLSNASFLYNGKIDPDAVIQELHEGLTGHGVLGISHYDEKNPTGTEPSIMLSGSKAFGQKVYLTETDLTGACKGPFQPDPIITPDMKFRQYLGLVSSNYNN